MAASAAHASIARMALDPFSVEAGSPRFSHLWLLVGLGQTAVAVRRNGFRKPHRYLNAGVLAGRPGRVQHGGNLIHATPRRRTLCVASGGSWPRYVGVLIGCLLASGLCPRCRGLCGEAAHARSPIPLFEDSTWHCSFRLAVGPAGSRIETVMCRSRPLLMIDPSSDATRLGCFRAVVHLHFRGAGLMLPVNRRATVRDSCKSLDFQLSFLPNPASCGCVVYPRPKSSPTRGQNRDRGFDTGVPECKAILQ